MLYTCQKKVYFLDTIWICPGSELRLYEKNLCCSYNIYPTTVNKPTVNLSNQQLIYGGFK